nr:unknown [Cloning vector pLDR9]|eukprot:Awhi_evm3s4441
MIPRDPRSPAPDLSAINQPAGRAERRSGPATLSASIQSINCCREARVSSSPVNSLRNVVAIATGIVVSRSSFGMASFSSGSQRSRRVT